MRREIVLLGDEVLRRKAKPVSAVDASTRRLMDDLVETMHAAHGLGLASPQVAVTKRVIAAHDGEGPVYVIANPVIKGRVGRVESSEGCLSMPGLYGSVVRSKKCVVTGLDRAGRQVAIEAQGLLARAFQHEVDHLNGVLFIDHARDLWFTVEVPAEEAGPVLEDDEVTADGRVIRHFDTTVSEVYEYFADLRCEQAAKAAGEVVAEAES